MTKEKRQLLLLALLIGGASFLIVNKQEPSFETLNPQEMRQRLIKEKDLAIQKAVEAGNYRCCIEPPCTMCYEEGNRWNNLTPGTCACDQLIAEGKEPCPQCRKGLCETSEKGTCKIDEALK